MRQAREHVRHSLIRIDDARPGQNGHVWFPCHPNARRDLAHSDPRFVFARHSWRTDNHIAALGLIEAGLGWAWQLCTLVQPRIKAGSLVTMAFENLSNGVQLWVDVTWSKERLLGLGRGALCN